jgi:hypothetical protein
MAAWLSGGILFSMNGDFKKSFWYCLLMVIVLVTLFRTIRSGLDRSVPMSKTSRAIRVFGGSFWAATILLGMAFAVYEAIR